MTCDRCNGLIVSDQLCDLQGRSSSHCVDCYRCLLCGDLVDALIFENRRRSVSSAEPVMLASLHMPRMVPA